MHITCDAGAWSTKLCVGHEQDFFSYVLPAANYNTVTTEYYNKNSGTSVSMINDIFKTFGFTLNVKLCFYKIASFIE